MGGRQLNKKIILIIGILFVISSGIVTSVLWQDASIDREEKIVNVHEMNEKESKEKSAPVQVVSNTDPLNTMSAYIEEGEQCKEIEAVKERGDCFQKAHAYYSFWTFNQAKEEFYFPFHHDQSDWHSVFSLPIEGSDQLGMLEKANHYETYAKAYGSDAQVDIQGTEILENYWYVFSSFIPQEERTMLLELVWMDTGDDYVFAVGFAEDDYDALSLTFSTHVMNYSGAYKSALIHEYGHMLTLNKDQLLIDEALLESEDEDVWTEAEEQCSTYFTIWGCAQEDSYLFAFYEAFWKDVYAEYEAINWDDETDYEQFFFSYEDRFFNSYQGTSPAEDIAESFTFFIMTQKKDDTEATEMKDEKITFFYNYDELVQLRTDILENIYELNKRDGEYY